MLNEAQEAAQCQSICCISHANLITAIEAAVESGREHPDIPALVVAHQTCETMEEEHALQHMVGVIDFQTPPNDPKIN